MLHIRGFTLSEVLFSFSIMMMIMTFCIPFLISLRQSEIRTRNEVTDQIQEMELKLKDLFYPVEDVEWALESVLL